MNKICIDLSEIKIFIYYMIMFPFQLTERLFPIMDTGIKILQIIVFLLCVLEIIVKKNFFVSASEIGLFLFLLWGMVSTFVRSPSEIVYYVHWTIFPFVSMIAFSKCFYLEGFEKAVKCISKFYAISIWVNFFLMIFFPNGIIYSNVGAVAYRANWLFGSKNNIVSELPYILMFLFYDMYIKESRGENIKIRYITIGIMLYSFCSMGAEKVEFMGGSTTGIIAIIFFICMYGLNKLYYLGKIRGVLTIKLITVTSLLLMGVVVLISQGKIKFVDNILLLLGKNRTFSGRSYVWKEGIISIAKYPIIGIGSAQQIFHTYGYSGNMNTGLYSFWITVLVRYGVVGLLLVMAMFFSIKYKADFQENGGFYIALGFFLMMIGGLSNPIPWKTVVFMVMSLVLYQRERETSI